MAFSWKSLWQGILGKWQTLARIVSQSSLRVLSRDRAGRLSRRGQALSFLTLPPRRTMIQEGWVRRCQHTRLWIHPCERPSSCASRRRLQSARANTDQAESIPSWLDSLPREFTPSLGMPGPVWADLETHTFTSQGCHIHRKKVLQRLPGHLLCSHSFLYIGPFYQSNILEFWRIFFFGWLDILKAETPEKSKVFNEVLCQCAAFSLSSYALGHRATAAPISYVSHVCYFHSFFPRSFFQHFFFGFFWFLFLFLYQSNQIHPTPYLPVWLCTSSCSGLLRYGVLGICLSNKLSQ